MDALDSKVIDALREKLLAPDRLAAMLTAFAERRTQRAAAISERLIGLQQEANAARDKLDRLYKLVEDGAELDDVLDREGEAILTSVGGYRLEGPSIRLFETVSGDYFTILGLPLLPLLAALRSFGPETLT